MGQMSEQPQCPDCKETFSGDEMIDHERHGRCHTGEQPQVEDSTWREWTCKDGVVYFAKHKGWPMRYKEHAVEVVNAHGAALAAEREKYKKTEISRDLWEEAAKKLDKQLAAAKGAMHHMEACRALLGVPDDEVLYQAIKELQEQLAAKEANAKLKNPVPKSEQ